MKAQSPRPRYRTAVLTAVVPIALAICGGTWAAAKDAPAQPMVNLSAPLPLDEHLAVHESLPNGLTLWVRPHAMPKGRVALWMRIGTGSVNEEENQRGLAHYLEHLAFNGSANFPPGSAIRLFESFGMQFGADQNAFTTFDNTTYMMDVPDPDEVRLRRALLFLSDVAHRLLLQPQEIEKERAVILEEVRARSGPQQRLFEKILPLVAPGSRLSERLPLGLESVIREAGQDRFRSYYKQWYRPDLTHVMVVGDVDPALVSRLVREAFKDWTRPEDAQAPLSAGLPSSSTLRAAVATDPELTAASISLLRLLPPDPVRAVGDYRTRLVENLGTAILERRIKNVVRAGGAPFQDGGVGVQTFAGHRLADASVEGSPGDWRAATRALLLEVRRLHEHGILPAELDLAREALLAGFGEEARAEEKVSASRLLAALHNTAGSGSTPMSASQRHRLAERLLPGVGAEEVAALLGDRFDLSRGVLVLTLPSRDGEEKPSDEVLLALAAEVRQTAVAPPTGATSISTLVDKRPAPGKVKTREVTAPLGTTTLSFENGLIAHVRPMAEAKRVTAHVVLYGGIAEEVAATRGLTALVRGLWQPGRLATRRHSSGAISDYLSRQTFGMGASIGEAALVLVLDGDPAGMAAAFDLAFALLSEPFVEEAALAAVRAELLRLLEDTRLTPMNQGGEAMRTLLGGAEPRFRNPKPEEVNALDRARVQAWMERLASQAPIEVSVAGAIDLKEAEALLSRTLGALPARTGAWEAWRKVVTIPVPKGPAETSVEVPTVTPVAAVRLTLLGGRRSAPEELAALFHASLILDPRLLEEVREKRGLTYSIQSQHMRSLIEATSGLHIVCTADPLRATEAAQAALEVVRALAKDGPTEKEIATAQLQAQAALAAQQQVPGFWAQLLTGWAPFTGTLQEACRYFESAPVVSAPRVTAVLQALVREENVFQAIARGASKTGSEASKDGEPKPNGESKPPAPEPGPPPPPRSPGASPDSPGDGTGGNQRGE